jgi:glycosyltransferase involved in cell wall biosynthesis
MGLIMAKILVLGSHAESLIIFRYDMLLAMAKEHEVIACVPESTPAVIQKLKNANIKYIDVKLARTGLNPIADLGTVYYLYKIFRRYRPDQVFLYTGKPVIYGSIAAKLAGVGKIYSMITGIGSYFIHQDLKSRIVRSIMSILYKVALSFNTKVFFQNLDDVADFANGKIFNDPSRTVLTNGSGVNLQYFEQLPLPVNKISFLLTARFILAKGVIEYLTAAKQIKQQYPQVEFLLVGWYENKDESIQPSIIQQYIDQGVIQYLGKLEDVRPALAQSSVFVLPSYREGTPKTVLEAMACGRAIISTNVPGCKETVNVDVNGFLVPARDVASLREAMEKFIINPELIVQMGQSSRELAVKKYDVNQVNTVILNAMAESAI